MADPNPEAVFAELARKEGYSDDEIVAALKQRKASTQLHPVRELGSKAVQSGDVRAAQMEGLKEGVVGGAKGFAKGLIHSPENFVRGIGSLIANPADTLAGMANSLENLPHTVMTAGAHPEEWGQDVGNLTGQAMIAEAVPGAIRMGASLPAKAVDIATKHPVATGAALGYATRGPMGAIEGALGGGVAGRLLKRAGEGPEIAPEAVPTTSATADVLSADDVVRLKKQGYDDAMIQRIRDGLTNAATKNAAAPALAMKVGTPMSAAERAVSAEKRVMARGDTLEARGREAFQRGRANAMADSRGLPEPSPSTALPPSSIPDASFVRGVPAQPMMPERTGLPPHRAGIPMNPSPNDASFVRSIPAEVEEIVTDPKTGRGKRAYSSGGGAPLPVKEGVVIEPETPRPVASHAPSFASEVKRLSDEGYGAEDIGDRLKGHPELKDASSRAARTNLVREARGGDSGQIPARVRKAVDDAIEGLKTDADRRAYLLRAPNAAIYTYVKSKLGL